MACFPSPFSQILNEQMASGMRNSKSFMDVYTGTLEEVADEHNQWDNQKLKCSMVFVRVVLIISTFFVDLGIIIG